MDWLDIALAAVISLLAVATWWFVAVRRQWDKRCRRWSDELRRKARHEVQEQWWDRGL